MSNAVLIEPTARKRRGVSTKTATNHVHRNLVRKPKSNGASEFSGLSLDTVENFAKDISFYLADVSNLSASTIDAADYEWLLEEARRLEEWAPKRARARKAVAALKIESTDEPVVPPARKRKGVKVAVAVEVPPVTVTAVLPKEKKAKPEPVAGTTVVPANWRYMAENANTEAARKWWTEYCNRRMRGEV